MTGTTTAAITIRSGWCGAGWHNRCRGNYGGYPCDRACHEPTAMVEPDPPPPPAVGPPPDLPHPGRHCATCSCEDHQ